MHEVTLLGMQGFTQLPEAGSLKFPNQPYNFVERVSAIAIARCLQTCSA